MFKQVIIVLFTISMIAVLWTKANAGCAFFGGSLYCASWIPGSVIANVSIDCVDVGCVSSPVKDDVSLFGNVPIPPSMSRTLSGCGMGGTLVCDNDGGTPTILVPPNVVVLPFLPYEKVAHVALPLTGKANMNCKKSPCEATIEVDVKKCQGNAPNCCPDCCPSNTNNMTFIPDSFDGQATFSQNPGAKTGPPMFTINDANCELSGNVYICDSCTSSPPADDSGCFEPCVGEECSDS